MKKMASLLTVAFTSLGLMAAPMAMAAPHHHAPAKHQMKKAAHKKHMNKKKVAHKKMAKPAHKRAIQHR